MLADVLFRWSDGGLELTLYGFVVMLIIGGWISALVASRHD